MGALITSIVNFFYWLMNEAWLLIWAVFDQLQYWLLEALGWLIEWGFSQLPTGWAEFLSRNPFHSNIWTLANDLDWIIGWKNCLGVFIFATSVIAMIRLVRWVLGIKVAGFGLDT